MSETSLLVVNPKSTIPQNFQADWPEELDPQLKSTCSKILKFIWEIFSWIILPIALIRLRAAHLKDYLYRIAILPASNYKNTIENFENLLLQQEELLFQKFPGEKVTLTAPDDATIDAAFFPGEIKDKVIIYTCGNGGLWQYLKHDLKRLIPLGVSILMINPREVGHGEGEMSSEGFALDVYTAFEYLIHEMNIDPNKILLVGHSMGGGYGALGAALIQKKYPDKMMMMISERSYVDLATESGAIVITLGHRVVGKGCMRELLCRIGGSLAPVGITLLGMQIDERKAFLSLKGEKGIIFSSEDQIIPFPSSLYHALEDELSEDIHVIEMDEDHAEDPGWTHNREYNVREKMEFYQLVNRLLNLEKDFFTQCDANSAHDLKNRTEIVNL